MSNNIFKNEKVSMLPFIAVGAVLILAIICVTIYSKSKQPKDPSKVEFEVVEITDETTTIPDGDPYTAEPVTEALLPSITNENIGEFTDTIIEGSDLKYLLSTMDESYAYLVSSESINRMESIVIGDYITTAYVEKDGMYTSRTTKDSGTGELHDEMFLNVGRTIDGITSIRWDEVNRVFYSSGTLRVADIAKIIYDSEKDERYKDVFVKMFVPWDHRGAFKDDDQFYVRELFSIVDDSLMGYVFEQTAIQFIGESLVEVENFVADNDYIEDNDNIEENGHTEENDFEDYNNDEDNNAQ